tara:strand:+ start:83 stop:1084 length:1002 start_codon:yes stop_codon:yes gene_type:complete
MKKIFVIFFLISGLSYSQCEVNPYIEQNYITDAWVMVFRNFVEIPNHPDYNLPILDPNKTVPYLEKISAVYEQASINSTADSLFNKFSIHTNQYFPKLVSFGKLELWVPETTPWVFDFIDTGISGDPILDQLMQDYQFSITNVAIVEPPPIYVISISSSIDYLNAYALIDDFESVDGIILTEPSFPDTPYNYTGIPFEIDNEAVRASNMVWDDNTLTFTLHTANCWTTCEVAKAWVAEVSEDCSKVTINLLGVQESSISLFSIYPNPVSERLFLKNLTSENYSIKLYSILGQVISSIDFSSEEINVAELTAGIYFIEINTNDGKSQVQKFIKK